MIAQDLRGTARAIVAGGKGLLAADETPPTLTRQLDARGIASTPDTRRAYRELMFSTPDLSPLIGGVILQDETIHQRASTGQPLAELLADRDIIPGIKVDLGTTELAGAPGERVTEGLDGLRERLEDYRELGARFAKWRAIFFIGERLPTRRAVRANTQALARYAALCQEQGLVPIVEPEVLMEGDHPIERCAEVTAAVLHVVFDALFEMGVAPEGMLLKPNMVTAGHDCPEQASVQEVADLTLATLMQIVPPAVPGIVFLSGGQSPVLATEHLNAINQLRGPRPWPITFSYGRALQEEALNAWKGRRENVAAAQRAFRHRAECDRAAALGRYRAEMERSNFNFSQAA